MKKNLLKASLTALCVLALVFAGCGPADTTLDLTGSISIGHNDLGKSAQGYYAIGDVLKAIYSGDESVTYEWTKGSDVVGTNSATYTPTTAGNYKVTVKADGYYDKTSAEVTVVDTAGFSTFAGSLTIDADGDLEIGVTLTANYTGAETGISYQWQKDGAVNVGTNSASYLTTQAGSYRVTIKKADYHSLISDAVDVIDPDLLVFEGTVSISSAGTFYTGETLTANYDGSETVVLSYQWEKDGIDIGTNSATFTPNHEQAGSYTVTISAEGYNEKTSAPVTVGLRTFAGSLNIGTESNPAEIDEALHANYVGSETGYSYQWKKDGDNVGTNSETFTPTETGEYTVTISKAGYISKTSPAVNVIDPNLPYVADSVNITPVNALINTPLTANLVNQNEDAETLHYQWKKDGANIGGNTATYTPTTPGEYTVTVSSPGFNEVASDNWVTIYAAISNFTFTPKANLVLGFGSAEEDGTNSGMTIGNLGSAVGGRPGSYTYTLVAGEGSTDNALFTINSQIGTYRLDVDSSDLTVAKTYSVRIQVKDGLDQTFAKAVTFTVGYPTPWNQAQASTSGGFTIVGTAPNSDDGGAVTAYQSGGGGAYFTIITQALKFREAHEIGDDISSWFTPNPGVTFELSSAVAADTNYQNVQVQVSGIPSAASTAALTIKIPGELIWDENGYPTTGDVTVTITDSITYNIDKEPENVVELSGTKYTSLQAAIDAAPAGDSTITVIRDIELSSKVSVPAGKTITLVAEGSNRTISAAADFVDSSNEGLIVGSGFILGGGGASHTPTLIIDGTGLNYLVTLSSGNLVLNRGAEIRNSNGRGVFLSSGNFTMEGGAIAGCSLGITLYGGTFTMNDGIIYGNSASGAGANANSSGSIQNSSGTVAGTVDGIAGLTGSSSDTWGTAP